MHPRLDHACPLCEELSITPETPHRGRSSSRPPGSSHDAAFPAAFLEFVHLFNEQRFWESHEALEGRWRATESDFYQGLIIFASAFVHAQRGNRHGVLAQIRKAEAYLDPYRPTYHGVDLEDLLGAGRAWQDLAEGTSREASAEEASAVWMRALPLPRIVPDRSLVRGDEPELAAGA